MIKQYLYVILFSLFIFNGVYAARTPYRPNKTNGIKQSNLALDEVDPNVSPVSLRPIKPVSVSSLIDNFDHTTVSSGVLTPLVSDQSNSTVSNQINEEPPLNMDDPSPIDKFCKCSETLCNCCRDFALPVIPVRGPACARIHYLGNEKMSIQIKYGDIVLASRTVNGKKSPPICVGFPGGYTNFCARIYGLSREKDSFKSCLSLELRSEDDIEAQLRVSCFRFGTQGFSVQEAEPVPPQLTPNKEDDDDDDIFGFGGDDGDGDEDDDEDDDDDEENEVNSDDEDTDYGFRGVINEIFGSGKTKKKTTKVIVEKIITNPEITMQNETQTDIINQLGEKEENNEESKDIIVPGKKSKSTNQKKKEDSDDYSFSDIFFGILNIF